ncbi:LodA/GoxA family CTQ-dependent oxidase [Pseudomonas asplenii]|uniref:LodA/GoxA family CTQ-dependent oxidase n=1 Tax=Pseudomonas asplenii TaxID=53407 RepID=UPI00235ED9A8|nr:LodA/GoxA family CTQ-dependent oxidase [Pseudomonas asplenii]
MSITPGHTPHHHGSQTPPKDKRIVSAAIHPAIGVARVGNSESDYFIGPQVTEPRPEPLGFYRDAQGALKRQAAEFRIYGYNLAGEVVAELTAQDAEITWSAHVANRKAQWYQWQLAMDIPEAASKVLPLRNAEIKDPKARAALAIDGGLQSIRGTNQAGVEFNGQYEGVPVYLGELRTDAQGRLLFLGGRGVSASPRNTPIFNPKDDNSFINADGWYDDTSDGPISAQVSIGGRSIPVESAWVVTAPPNYAPQVKTVRTLYDLTYDLFIQAGWLKPNTSTSFRQDVYPILQRLSGLQWVNQGFATQFGHNSPYNFEDPAFIAKLAHKPAPGDYDVFQETRRQILNSFRLPEPADNNPLPWPWIYGDDMELGNNPSPRQNSSITQTQYLALSRWADGQFEADWPGVPLPDNLDSVALAEQPAMLDRAALDFCLADAFHPGCELTWPMRHLPLYAKPWRIRQRPAGSPQPDYGPTLNQTQALAVGGPLYGQGPGDLNRWMGLPWQADTAYCRGGYNPDYSPFTATFWPARVPNQVLSDADYALVIDPATKPEQRLDAFADRSNWNAPLLVEGPKTSTAKQMTTMVDIFGSMGLLEVRKHVFDSPLYPNTMMVASYGPQIPTSQTFASPVLAADFVAAGAPTDDTAGAPRPPRGANFSSQEDAEQAPRGGRQSR